MGITKNTVWESKNSDELKQGVYRVLHIDVDRDAIILFELQERRISKPFILSFQRFSNMVKTRTVGRTRFVLPSYMLVDEGDIDPLSKRKRDENYQMILPLISDTTFLFEYAQSKRSAVLVKYASDKGVNSLHLRMLLVLYWRYGQNIYSLLPAYSKSGAPGKERKTTALPLGSKKKNRVLPMQRASTFLLKDTDKKNIVKSLRKYYLKVNGFSLTETYKKYTSDFFRNETERARLANEAPHIPSLRQFQYWSKKLITTGTRIRSKSTVSNFLQNQRARTGSAANTGTLPGDVFEIDATVADVHLVSALNKTSVIGRPTIYTVVDRATRMITGVHVSLYHASWRAARQALANCFMPKKNFCKLFGINISEWLWPCSHVPVKLICDNGEMIGLQPQDKVTPMTALEIAPVYRADRKSVVERRFGILNQKAIHPLLGSTRGGKIVKGEPLPASRACLTLQEVTRTIILAILEHNQSVFKELAYINPLLVEHDLAMSPLNSWKISLKKSRFSAHTISEDEVVSRLLPPEQVCITPGGLQYGNLFYECDDDLASAARVFGQSRCDARIDDNCVDYIYVRLDKNKPFTKHYLLEKRNIFKGMPHLESDVLADWIDLQYEKSPVTPVTHLVNDYAEKLNETGLQRLSSFREQNRSRTKNITENKKEELRRNADALEHESRRLPLTTVENMTLLPGPEEKVRWLATQKERKDAQEDNK
ncbi:transposase family protein [Salmonella enterica]|uniref:Transposase family protein n=4 Tax=Salmonella enterica TaxID=28901 RepID=A0A727RNY5_SALET|nr:MULTISPECIES: Tn7 transposition protein B [Enterobacteriaceae]ECT4811013.1 transposase [Salmonella enterica subsp. enterica serovar Rubislaw]ECV4715938.1 transposase [Salmonella enterica subsp. enterica serovar Java]EID9497217.1 transposase [Salmonella enterica subsp. enterica serovar Muenster]EKK5415831.1 transposase [Enterobacter hormaechei]EKR1460509.1 transposase [Salmonella enterica subsp. salamae serovar 47:b:1,5]